VPDSQNTTYHIAIVDDHEPVRSALSSLLRSFGHTSTEFDSAAALLALPTLAGIDCIVTDLQMPGMSGLELQQQLLALQQRDAGHAHLPPLIVMTAFPEEALRRRALASGAICFLTKPLDVTDLLRCLSSALAARLAGRTPTDPT
jgi:FixJ family two-component response regulator